MPVNWNCIDCNVPTKEVGEYYEVKPEVWPRTEQGLKVRGCLCLLCLEARIGRMLSFRDFTDSKANTVGNKSARLQHRVSRSATI